MLEYNKIEEYWDKNAANFAEKAGMPDNFSGPMGALYRTRREWRHFLKIVSPRPDWVVLDMGCGAGRWDFPLASMVKFIRAVDLSANMIGLAEKEKEKRGISNIEFVKSSIMDFDPPEKYDLIYLSGMLNFLEDEDVEKAFARIIPALKTGGQLLSRDGIRPAGRKVRGGDYPVIHRPLEEYTAFFEKEGFCLKYDADSYVRPRADERFNKTFSREWQLAHPRIGSAVFEALEYLAQALVKTGFLAPLPPSEYRHMFLLFERVE